jgi:hypothetical protein
MTSQESLSVGGSENLEIMECAPNYIAYLVKEAHRTLHGCKRICDFGAGRGTIATRMQHLGYEVACVEPELTLQPLLSAQGLRVYPSLAEAPALRFEGIYSCNVLEHIEDDVGALRTIHSHLLDDGWLYLYVPAFQILFSSMDRRVGHVRRYRLDELVEKCRTAGFDVYDAGYSDSLGFFAALLYKALGSKDGTINEVGLSLYDSYAFPVSRLCDFVTKQLFGKNLWVRAQRAR